MKKEELIQKILQTGSNLTDIEIPEELKRDHDIALTIAKTNGHFIYKVDESIIDKEIVLEALKSNSYASDKVPEFFFNDKDVAMLIVSKNGHLLWKMSDKLIDDIDVVREAVKNDPDAIRFASDRIKNDSEFMKEYEQIKQEIEKKEIEKAEKQKQEKLAKVEEYKNSEIWWNDSSIVNYEKLDEAITDDMITRIENKYNKKLPSKYVELLKQQNGGRLIKRYFLSDNDKVFVVDSILGIPSVESTKSSLEYKTDDIRANIKEYELTAVVPDNIIVFGNDESGGHANYVFDYSELNEHGEPKIVYFDNEVDFKEIVTDSFDEFISNLKIREEAQLINPDVY